jgi:predicted nucleic acid-binding Zn ribbon protein
MKKRNETVCPVCGKDSKYPSLWCSDECEMKDSKLMQEERE